MAISARSCRLRLGIGMMMRMRITCKSPSVHGCSQFSTRTADISPSAVRITAGQGTANISQAICLVPQQKYTLTYFLGIDGDQGLDGNPGCDVTPYLGQTKLGNSQRPCNDPFAPSSFGTCNEFSVDVDGKYERKYLGPGVTSKESSGKDVLSFVFECEAPDEGFTNEAILDFISLRVSK